MEWIKGLGAFVVGVIVFFVVLIVVACIGIFGFGWFQRSTADFRGQTAAIEKTKANADFRLRAYDQFYDLCSQVQSLEDRIVIFEGDVKMFEGTSKEAVALTNLHALQAQRSSLIREYNAKASRGFTDGQFRSNDLPYQLDITDKETICA